MGEKLDSIMREAMDMPVNRKRTAFNIKQEIIDLYDRSMDPETGEVINPDFEKELMDLNYDLDTKLNAMCNIVIQERADMQTIKLEINRLDALKKIHENAANKLEEKIANLCDWQPWHSTLHSLKITHSHATEYPEKKEELHDVVAKMPEEYLIPQDPKLNIEKLKKDILDGKLPNPYNDVQVIENINATVK